MSTSEVTGKDHPILEPDHLKKPKVDLSSTTKLPPHTPPSVVSSNENMTLEVQEKELPQEAAIAFYKANIANMRGLISKMLETGTYAGELSSFVSDNYTALISSAATFAEMKLGADGKDCPVKYVIGGLGSLARGDVSPYSDLDFVFIVEEDQPGTRKYFEELLGVMREVILGLGETGPKAGIQFCTGGLTPPYQKLETKRKDLGGSPHLYGTPEEIASNAHKPYRSREVMIPSASPAAVNIGLQQVGFIHGDRKVLQKFIEERDKLYREPSSDDPKKTTRQMKGLEFMGSSFSHMAELGDLEKTLAQDTGYIDVKKLILRPISAIVGGLCIYHGIEKTNTLESIDALVARKHLNHRFADKLIETFSLGTVLRHKAQIAAEKEEDKVSIGTAGPKGYPMSAKEKQELQECQRALFALRDAHRKFVESKGDSKAFN